MYFLKRAFIAVILFVSAFPSSSLGQTTSPGRTVTLSDQEYGRRVLSELSKKYSLEHNHPRFGSLTEIVRRLTAAAHVNQVPWKVYLFRDDSFRNAAATRGNYVFIWTGLLDVVQTEELAVILAHVIAHVMAGHTDPDPEIESQKMLVDLAVTAGHIASGSSGAGHIITDGLGNIATAITRKKERRKKGYRHSPEHEQEADEVSLRMVADAGYEPREVLFFWMRARNDRSFEQSVHFFRAHPPYYERLQTLGKLVEKAEQKRKKRVDPPR